MNESPKPGLSRPRFAAYVAVLLVAIVFLINREFFAKVFPTLLLVAVLLIIKAAVAPFIFGFVLQGVFSRRNIPNFIILLIAIISMVALWYFSGFHFLEQRSDLFIELFLLLGSIIVVKGFIDSGTRFFRKIRDRKQKQGKNQTTSNNERVE
jgi:ABC-type iron transport system FetAB permease component